MSDGEGCGSRERLHSLLRDSAVAHLLVEGRLPPETHPCSSPPLEPPMDLSTKGSSLVLSTRSGCGFGEDIHSEVGGFAVRVIANNLVSELYKTKFRFPATIQTFLHYQTLVNDN